MERDGMQALVAWRNKPKRKPLILRGARQVGKTWLMKEFGRLYFRHTVYVNFENAVELKSLFLQNLDVHRILQTLRPYQVYKPDAVVLGCTHYPLIKKIFQKEFFNACLLDGGLGTAKQAVRVLERVEKKTKGRGKVTFVCTKGWFYKQTLKKLYKRIKKEL